MSISSMSLGSSFLMLRGARDLVRGAVCKGVKKIVLGAGLGCIIALKAPVLPATVLKTIVTAGAALVAYEGIGEIKQSYSESALSKKIVEFAKGGINIIGAASVALLLFSIENTMSDFLILGCFCMMGMIATYAALANDRGNSSSNGFILLFSITLAVAALAFNSFERHASYENDKITIECQFGLSSNVTSILNGHKGSIYQAVTSPQLAKNSPLKQIGFGISKRTFAIDGLKKYVLKAPRLYEGDIGYRTNSSSEEIMLDYENQRMVERVVNNHNLPVVIPKTHLIEICKSSQEGSNCRNLLLTETVPVNRYINLNKTDYDKMHPQACRLISTAGLCDINFKQFHTLPDGGVRVATHNLAVLDSAEGLKLAPYDFDCMHESDFIKRVTLRINGCGLGPH